MALDDPSAILDHLNRLSDTVDSDPRLAVSTAKALIENNDLPAREIARKSMDIAADICIYTNKSIIVEELS